MGRHDSESPLSSMGDTDMEDSIMDDHDQEHDEPQLPPAKRQKIKVDSTSSSAIVPRGEYAAPEEDHDNNGNSKIEDLQVSDVSSDTSGSVPSSPQCFPAGRLEVEDDVMEQVTICAWDGCGDGDLGNMDELVRHIHGIHIVDLQQTGVYTCEWIGCSRKGKKHASGYALKAHMRSHTREKPFYCYLPECDRSFTRSDALAKHMRTVHETEALRPSDPVPKSMQPGGGQPGPNYATIPPLSTPSNGTGKRLKIVLKTPSHGPAAVAAAAAAASASAASADDSVVTDDEPHYHHPHNHLLHHHHHHSGAGASTDEEWQFTRLTEAAGFTPRELELAGPSSSSGGLERLHRLCRAQVQWATDEGRLLQDECTKLEELYWTEWREKEALLEQMIRSEEDWDRRRRAVLISEAEARATAAAAAAAAADNATTAGADSDAGERGEEGDDQHPSRGKGAATASPDGNRRSEEKRGRKDSIVVKLPARAISSPKELPKPSGGLMHPQIAAAAAVAGVTTTTNGAASEDDKGS